MVKCLDVVKGISAAEARIASGIRSVFQSTDFQLVQAEVRRQETTKGFESRVIPEMQWELNDLSAGTAFYLVVRNLDDMSLAALCGARLYDLGSDSLLDYFERQYVRLHGNGEQPLQLSKTAAEVRAITGRVAYLADFKIYPPRGRTPRINASDLILMVYGVCLLSFRPDWYCGMMRDASVRRGLTAQYLARSISYPLRWRSPVPGRRDSDHLLCMSSRETERLFELSAEFGHEALSGGTVAATE